MTFRGEPFVAATFGVILATLVSPMIEEIKFRWGIDQEVRKIGMMLAKIKVVLDDAEQMEITDNSVKMWLNDLKDVAYDVDDVMDEFAYEIERSKMEAEAETDTNTNQVWSLASSFANINPFSFKQMIASKIKDLIERLEELECTRVMLGLRERVGGRRMGERQKPSSVFNESDFVGRVDDKKKIIELLLSGKPGAKDVSVIPIVSIGGHGKTALVQAVYNDNSLKDYFEMKAWVCVSEEFDVKRLTQAILESATLTKYDFENLDPLQVTLKEKLREKRFLLVLDDVWNENQDDWDVLRAPFGVGAPGSRILVTTRSQKVSLIMGTIPDPYNLGGLSDEDCWSLFKHRAFGEGNSNAHENLEIIGKNIVKKCKGSPLAVKTLGGLLRSNEDVEKWNYVLNTEMSNLPVGNDYILGVLRLSYHHLPSPLKQCFAYCSIFPKDQTIKKEELVLMWMAEGFVQPEGRRCLEDIGKEYFDDLFLRSFFERCNWREGYFVMHDLVHDLTQSISGKFCCRLENHLSERTRHLSLSRSTNVENLEVFHKAKRLRTFFIMGNITLQPFHDFFEKLKYLRVVRLNTVMIDIPNSVSNLKHLRHLELFCYDQQKLPESIGRLFNLQILILRGYIELPNSIGNLKQLWHLALIQAHIRRLPDSIGSLKQLRHLVVTQVAGIERLPDSIGSLKQLRHLELIQTGIERLPDSIASLFNLQTLRLRGCLKLREILKDISNLIGLQILDILGCYDLVSLPLGFGKLTNIQELWLFPVSTESGANLGDLKDLNKLGGRFHIKGLENVINADEAKDAALKNKQNLKELQLEWGNVDRNLRDPSVEELVLESLQPHTNLQELQILGSYGGARFPKWMGDRSFSKLKSIRLEGGGECCQVLPALGQLPSLIYLEISKVLGLKHMGREFYGLEMSFPSLETLHLQDLPELEEWFGVEEDSEFLCLSLLTIIDCPKLRKLPHAFLGLERLTLESCNGLVVLPTYSPLKCLEIESCNGLVVLPSFPALQMLAIKSCNGLMVLQSFPTLHDLLIKSCNGLVVLPSFPVLKNLVIKSWNGLVVLPSFLALKILIIKSCEGLLVVLPTFPALKELTIRYCDRLVVLPTFPTLEKLRIESCKGLVVFPRLPTLWYLKLYSCDDMLFKSLPYLNSLSELYISGFKETTTFIEGFLGALHTQHPVVSSSTSTSTSTKTSRGSLSTTLKHLEISDFSNLEALSLKDFTSLESLEIGDCPKLVSFYVEWLPTTLKKLILEGCPIKHLPNGLQNLLSLEVLIIRKCYLLESLPEDGLPATLCHLGIYECELLQRRCREGGEDWPKISHILTIKIF